LSDQIMIGNREQLTEGVIKQSLKGIVQLIFFLDKHQRVLKVKNGLKLEFRTMGIGWYS
jgi:hypothetical protein